MSTWFPKRGRETKAESPNAGLKDQEGQSQLQTILSNPGNNILLQNVLLCSLSFFCYLRQIHT